MSQEPASSRLRSLCRLAREITGQVPDRPTAASARFAELASLRSTEGGGGRTRADLLELLVHDFPVVLGNLTLMIEGVADCIEAAENRNNEVNLPALTATVRPALEIAGQVAWLLDDSIDGQSRARRYLIWRFNDLGYQRDVLVKFRLGEESMTTATQELDEIERKILELTALAKWDARATVVHANGAFREAALLDAQRAQTMPKKTELIAMVSSTPGLYALLGVPAHGLRFGAFIGLVGSGEKADRTDRFTAKMTGFGLPPQLVIGLAILALVTATAKFAKWNGMDATELQRRAVDLSKSVGSVET